MKPLRWMVPIALVAACGVSCASKAEALRKAVCKNWAATGVTMRGRPLPPPYDVKPEFTLQLAADSTFVLLSGDRKNGWWTLAPDSSLTLNDTLHRQTYQYRIRAVEEHRLLLQWPDEGGDEVLMSMEERPAQP